MAEFKIITDSTADLPGEYIEQNHLGMMVLPYIVNEEPYGIDKEMDVKEFYQQMRGGMMPTTSQVNGKGISGKLSGRMQRASGTQLFFRTERNLRKCIYSSCGNYGRKKRLQDYCCGYPLRLPGRRAFGPQGGGDEEGREEPG